MRYKVDFVHHQKPERLNFDILVAADNRLDLVPSETEANWDSFVVKVNRSLDRLDLEFRHLLDETSGKEMYAMVGLPFPFYPGRV